MKKNEKSTETSINKKKQVENQLKKVDTHHDKLNKIPIPEKGIIKSKLLNINNGKFNSLKPEKSPDKMISNYKQMSKNIKKKTNHSANTTTKTNTSTSTTHGATSFLSKNTNKSVNSFGNKSDKQKTSYQDLTSSQTIRIDVNPTSENSEFIIHENKACLNENFIPIIEIDFSDKILNLVEKISNFLIASAEEPTFIYSQENKFLIRKSIPINDYNEVFNTKVTHSRKNLSANLDRVFIDSLMQNQKDYQINKLDMFYQEIENIYDMSIELNDSVKLTQNSCKLTDHERRYEEIPQLSTQALLNIEMIKDYSDGRMSTYKRLLTSCIINFKEISEEILLQIGKNKDMDKSETYFNVDPYPIMLTSPNKDINHSDSQNKGNNSGGKDKNSLINEKLEMLRNLKEKKDQILYENQNQCNNSKKNFKSNRTLKMKERTMTEIDPSDSYLNENVIVNNLPTSNINNVNKPSEQNLPYKNCIEEFEGVEYEQKGNSHDESEIMFNLEDCIEDQAGETIKQANDTVLQTCNDFMKSHKRSKSHFNPNVIPANHIPNPNNQLEKPGGIKSSFLFAKKEFIKDRPLIYVGPEILSKIELNEIDQIHPEVRKNFAASIHKNNCVII